MTQSQWLTDFRRKLKLKPQAAYVRSLAADAATEQPTLQGVNNNVKGSNFIRNLTVFILLPLLILGAAFAKKMYLRNANAAEQQVLPVQPLLEPTPLPTPPPVSDTELQSLKARTALLGALLNNNTYVIKNTGNAEDLLYLNQDWTINRLPPYISDPSACERFLKR